MSYHHCGAAPPARFGVNYWPLQKLPGLCGNCCLNEVLPRSVLRRTSSPSWLLMLRARLITHSVEDSAELAAQLRERGYQVETVLVGDGSCPPARADLAAVDLEISLKEYSPEEALNRAGVQPIGRDLCVFIAPGAIAERSPVRTNPRPKQSAHPEPVGELVSATPQRAPSHVPVTTNPPPAIIRPQLQRGSTRAWRRVHLRLRLPVFHIPSLPDPRLLKRLPFWETASVSVILAIAVLIVGGFVSSRALLPQDFSSFPATALHESAYTQASTTSHFLDDPNGGSAPPRQPDLE